MIKSYDIHVYKVQLLNLIEEVDEESLEEGDSFKEEQPIDIALCLYCGKPNHIEGTFKRVACNDMMCSQHTHGNHALQISLAINTNVVFIDHYVYGSSKMGLKA